MHVFEQHGAVAASVACRFVLRRRSAIGCGSSDACVRAASSSESVCCLQVRAEFLFVSVILAPDTWSRHSFSQSDSDPKPASHGRTLGPKGSESLEKNKFVSICLGHLGPGHLVPPQLFPI